MSAYTTRERITAYGRAIQALEAAEGLDGTGRRLEDTAGSRALLLALEPNHGPKHMAEMDRMGRLPRVPRMACRNLDLYEELKTSGYAWLLRYTDEIMLDTDKPGGRELAARLKAHGVLLSEPRP